MNFPAQVKIGSKHCDKHGIDYEASAIEFGDRKIEQPCPKCIEDATSKKQAEDRAQRAQDKQRLVGLSFKKSGIPPRYTTRTFENYTCKTKQQETALEMAMEYSKNITENMESGAGLILSGKPGTGKTHLACAIGCKYISTGSVLFTTVSSMIRRIRTSYRKDSDKSEQDIIDEFRSIDLLIIDEIGVQKGSESEENLLFEVINERYSYFKPTILVSNLNAQEMKKYIGARALDRMREGGGKFIAFDWDSYRSEVVKDSSLPNLNDAAYGESSEAKKLHRYERV